MRGAGPASPAERPERPPLESVRAAGVRMVSGLDHSSRQPHDRATCAPVQTAQNCHGKPPPRCRIGAERRGVCTAEARTFGTYGTFLQCFRSEVGEICAFFRLARAYPPTRLSLIQAARRAVDLV